MLIKIILLIVWVNAVFTDPINLKPAPKNTTYCYDYVGCFDNNEPFDNTGLFLPNSPELIGTEFMLFTRENRDTEQILSYKNASSIRYSNFNRNLPLKIIVHGFGQGRDKPWLHDIKNAFLDTDNFNVIITGWGNGATFPFYNNASTNLRVVAKEMGLVVNIIANLFYRRDPFNLRVHCIGHSLGAHLCGHAGKESIIFFDRITGLDPANQFFEGRDSRVRLDTSDAKFVDAIHSNTGSVFGGSFGIVQPVGHIDFYPNGGSLQPGCRPLSEIIGAVFDITFDPESAVGCSHNRVCEYFVESIRSQCSFRAYKCSTYKNYKNGKCLSCENDSCSILGYYASGFKGRGSFYGDTVGDAPYCAEQYSFEMKINAKSNKTAGELYMDFKNDGNDLHSIKLTNIDTDLETGSYVKRVFVSQKALLNSQKYQLRFVKKPVSWIGSIFDDGNDTKFFFDKIKLMNIRSNEIHSVCSQNTMIENGETSTINIEKHDCN